jgi:hypothetical protein
MSFVHDDPDFPQLLGIVAHETGIAAALVEKDYWVTHCQWALHATGLEIWFKGGTSLSKGFGLIRRFSEDLDLMIQHGSVTDLPAVANWTSTNKGPVAARHAFYDALPGAFAMPAVKVEVDSSRQDKQARGVDLIGRYPGVLLDRLAPTMSPFVRFEIGRARVVPFVTTEVTSRRVLARYDNGTAALVEADAGKGRLLLFTSSIDRDWDDLPIHPGFVALVQQTVRHLARVSPQGRPRELVVGQQLLLDVAADTVRLEVDRPGGHRAVIEGEALAERRQVRFARTDQPGFYRVYRR